jgi:hypothetical protein
MKKLKQFIAVLFLGGLLLSGATAVLARGDATALDGLDATAGSVPAFHSQITNPSGDATTQMALVDRIGGIVGLILSFVGIIFLVLTVYAGITWMTAQGNSAQVEKAKTLLINAIIGLIIITAAYSITMFIGGQLVK